MTPAVRRLYGWLPAPGHPGGRTSGSSAPYPRRPPTDAGRFPSRPDTSARGPRHEVPGRTRRPRRRRRVGGAQPSGTAAGPGAGRCAGRGVRRAGRRPAHRLRFRLRDVGPRRARRHHRRSGARAGVRAVACRHHPRSAVEAGRPRRRRVARHDQLRQQPVQPPDDAGRGLPAAAGHAAARRHGGGRGARRGRRAGRGGGGPGRHAPDAHRHPAGDRGLPAHARGHRPVPARGARAGLARPRTTRSRARC